ncbi:hypothetical protein [Enterococcus sp.]|uniref:hypothetical protein n=1 Tax=Enterococcus sp. TaxID=35783 RepID=UPI002FC9B003
MVSMTKITTTENFQRSYVSFSHALIFAKAVQGTSLSKNSRIIQKSMTIRDA